MNIFSKKPELESFIRIVWKNGEIGYYSYRLVVQTVPKIHAAKTLISRFPEQESYQSLEWKNVQKWEYVFPPISEFNNNTWDRSYYENMYDEFEKFRKNFWETHKDTLKINNPESDAQLAWNKCTDDLNFIYFLEEWVDGIGFSDGEIESPDHSLSLVFKVGYNQAIKDVFKVLKENGVDLKNLDLKI